MNEQRQITALDVQVSRMRETMHGHGKDGMYIYEYRCDQYPRLTRTIRCEKRRTHEVTRWFVDGAEVATTAVSRFPPANLAELIADALNRPHDLAGIVDRFNARSYRAKATGLVDGRLVVTGESAERCIKLCKSYPDFEGIPIDWQPGVADADPKDDAS